MTQVEFHTGVEDPVDFACRLLRKAYRTGVRVLATAPAERLLAIDRALWSVDERDFVAHARVPSVGAVLLRSPLWLATDAGLAANATWPVPNVLVNVGADAPASFEGLARLIEVVGASAEERDAGRLRWRTYKAQGLAITHREAAA